MVELMEERELEFALSNLNKRNIFKANLSKHEN